MLSVPSQIFSRQRFIKLYTFVEYIQKVCSILPELLALCLFTHQSLCPALFKRYRKYGVAVFMCEHHGVKEYIEVVVKSCREWLIKVAIKRHVLCVVDSVAGRGEEAGRAI